MHALERNHVCVIPAVSHLHMPLARFYVVRWIDGKPSDGRQKGLHPGVALCLDGLARLQWSWREVSGNVAGGDLQRAKDGAAKVRVVLADAAARTQNVDNRR